MNELIKIMHKPIMQLSILEKMLIAIVIALCLFSIYLIVNSIVETYKHIKNYIRRKRK